MEDFKDMVERQKRELINRYIRVLESRDIKKLRLFVENEIDPLPLWFKSRVYRYFNMFKIKIFNSFEEFAFAFREWLFMLYKHYSDICYPPHLMFESPFRGYHFWHIDVVQKNMDLGFVYPANVNEVKKLAMAFLHLLDEQMPGRKGIFVSALGYHNSIPQEILEKHPILGALANPKPKEPSYAIFKGIELLRDLSFTFADSEPVDIKVF